MSPTASQPAAIGEMSKPTIIMRVVSMQASSAAPITSEIFHDQEQIGNRFDAAVKAAAFGMKNELVVGFDSIASTSATPTILPMAARATWISTAIRRAPLSILASTLPKYDTETRQYAHFARIVLL